jgi:phosphoribosylglycinamide formyltransferase 1
MYGMHVHRAVLAAGDRTTGASVHLIESDYDTGPVLGQRVVAVQDGDTAETLAERVQKTQRVLIVEVLRDFAEGARALPVGGNPPRDST